MEPWCDLLTLWGFYGRRNHIQGASASKRILPKDKVIRLWINSSAGREFEQAARFRVVDLRRSGEAQRAELWRYRNVRSSSKFGATTKNRKIFYTSSLNNSWVAHRESNPFPVCLSRRVSDQSINEWGIFPDNMPVNKCFCENKPNRRANEPKVFIRLRWIGVNMPSYRLQWSCWGESQNW